MQWQIKDDLDRRYRQLTDKINSLKSFKEKEDATIAQKGPISSTIDRPYRGKRTRLKSPRRGPTTSR